MNNERSEAIPHPCLILFCFYSLICCYFFQKQWAKQQQQRARSTRISICASESASRVESPAAWSRAGRRAAVCAPALSPAITSPIGSISTSTRIRYQRSKFSLRFQKAKFKIHCDFLNCFLNRSIIRVKPIALNRCHSRIILSPPAVVAIVEEVEAVQQEGRELVQDLF